MEQVQAAEPNFLQKEKQTKDAIRQTKFEKDLIIEQNKLQKAQNDKARVMIDQQRASADSWKAWYEKMYYSIECEKIEPEYKAYQERIKLRMEEEKKAEETFIKTLQEKADVGNEKGEAKIEVKLPGEDEAILPD